jgi:hypothetical protein
VKLRALILTVSAFFAAALMVQERASACTIRQIPVSLEERNQRIADSFRQSDTVVRVRVMKGGDTTTFLVMGSYKGKLRPFDRFTWNSGVGTTCDRQPHSHFFDGGILKFNSGDKQPPRFRGFEDDETVRKAINFRLIPRRIYYTVDNFLLLLTIVLISSGIFLVKTTRRRHRLAEQD